MADIPYIECSKKLKVVIKEQGLKNTFLIKKLGISKTSFYKKLANPLKFTVAEAYMLQVLLHLTEADAAFIFFGQKVA